MRKLSFLAMEQDRLSSSEAVGTKGAAKQGSLSFLASVGFRVGWCQTQLLEPNLLECLCGTCPLALANSGWLSLRAAVRQVGKGCNIGHLFFPPPCPDTCQPADLVAVFCGFPEWEHLDLSVWYFSLCSEMGYDFSNS